MSGTHRDPTGSGVTPAGVAQTVGLVLIPVALLAVAALALYFGLTRQADTWPAVVAIQSVNLLVWLGPLISQLRKPRTPEWLVVVIRKAGLPAVLATGLLIPVGRLLGWNSSLEDAVSAITGLVVLGYLAYSFGGERRLLAVLQARAARREGPA